MDAASGSTGTLDLSFSRQKQYSDKIFPFFSVRTSKFLYGDVYGPLHFVSIRHVRLQYDTVGKSNHRPSKEPIHSKLEEFNDSIPCS